MLGRELGRALSFAWLLSSAAHAQTPGSGESATPLPNTDGSRERWERDRGDPQRFSLEYATLTSDDETFRGVSMSGCAHSHYPDLGFPNAICLGGQLTVLGTQRDLGNRAQWFLAMPLIAGISWQAYASPGALLGINAGIGALLAVETDDQETKKWVELVGRLGVDVTAFRLTVGADVYLMDGMPLLLRAGFAL